MYMNYMDPVSGDVTGDWILNVADIIAVVNYIVWTSAPETFIPTAESWECNNISILPDPCVCTCTNGVTTSGWADNVCQEGTGMTDECDTDDDCEVCCNQWCNTLTYDTWFTDWQFQQADVNGDGIINVVDLTAIVNMILDTVVESYSDDGLIRNNDGWGSSSMYSDYTDLIEPLERLITRGNITEDEKEILQKQRNKLIELKERYK